MWLTLRRAPNIQHFWTKLHTDNFEAIKKMIVKVPVLHLPNRDGKCSLECDSSAKHIGAVLYQLQNGCNNIIAFFGSTMPDAPVRYSRSELELCGLKKSILHFQYLLKYANFRVIMDHSALRNIYCTKKPAKTIRIQMFWKKYQIIFSLLNMFLEKTCLCQTFCHAFQIIMMMLYHFLTDTSECTKRHFMAILDKKCKFDYLKNSGLCMGHSYPVTCSHTKSKKIQMPSLFPNPPAKIKRVTAPIVGKVHVSNMGSPTSTRDPVMLPASTTTPVNHLLHNKCAGMVGPARLEIMWIHIWIGISQRHMIRLLKR